MSRKYCKTAIPKKSPSPAIRWLIENGHIKTHSVLDYGCGRGQEAGLLGFDKYDPVSFPILPKKKYDIVICQYVLCTVFRKQDRDVIIDKVKTKLKKGGKAFFIVRRDIVGSNFRKNGTWQGNVRIDLPSIKRNKSYEIYMMEN